MCLRVLLAKWPDICEPTFFAQYLFGSIIKSTHLGDVPRAKSWDLGAYTVPKTEKRDFSGLRQMGKPIFLYVLPLL